MFKPFGKKDQPDADPSNTDQSRPNPVPEDNTPPPSKGARDHFNALGKSTKKTLEAAKNKAGQAGSTVKNSVKKTTDTVTSKTKSACDNVTAPYKKAAENRKEKRDEKRAEKAKIRAAYPTSGSTLVDLIFPTGGLAAEDKKPEQPEQPEQPDQPPKQTPKPPKPGA